MNAAGLLHTGEECSQGRAIGIQIRPAFRGDCVQLLCTVAGIDRRMAEFLEQRQRRIDNAWAWAVGAADLIFDLLDDLVTVPRLFGDQVEND